MAQKPNNRKASPKKLLSMLIASDGLSFCVTTEGLAVQSFFEKQFSSPQNPENLLKEIQSYFTYTFSDDPTAIDRVHILYAHSLYAPVPLSYFDENRLSDYLKFNVKLLPTDELAFDRLEDAKINVVFVPYTNINNYIFEKFGEFSFAHAVSSFVEQCSTKTEPEGVFAFANVFSTHFDLCVFENGALLLCNSYDYFSPEDFAYYLLFAIEQLKLDTETLHLNLCGALEKDSAIFDLLYTYVRHIGFFDLDHELTVENISLKAEPPHRHQFLLNSIHADYLREA